MMSLPLIHQLNLCKAGEQNIKNTHISKDLFVQIIIIIIILIVVSSCLTSTNDCVLCIFILCLFHRRPVHRQFRLLIIYFNHCHSFFITIVYYHAEIPLTFFCEILHECPQPSPFLFLLMIYPTLKFSKKSTIF